MFKVDRKLPSPVKLRFDIDLQDVSQEADDEQETENEESITEANDSFLAPPKYTQTFRNLLEELNNNPESLDSKPSLSPIKEENVLDLNDLPTLVAEDESVGPVVIHRNALTNLLRLSYKIIQMPISMVSNAFRRLGWFWGTRKDDCRPENNINTTCLNDVNITSSTTDFNATSPSAGSDTDSDTSNQTSRSYGPTKNESSDQGDTSSSFFGITKLN